MVTFLIIVIAACAAIVLYVALNELYDFVAARLQWMRTGRMIHEARGDARRTVDDFRRSNSKFTL